MLVISVVGARPNFMKMGPVVSALEEAGIHQYLVHTGQHYDNNMSQVFFDELNLPKPDIFLGVGSGSHGYQTGEILFQFEKICIQKNPKLIIVAGDINSTLACALAASKLNIPIAHIEAGLRSFDNTMPEEINRILTDKLSDMLFVTEKSGVKNLKSEGINNDRIHLVGNCMIDSIKNYLPKAIMKAPWVNYNLKTNEYCLVTIHRPSNVDSRSQLKSISKLLNKMAEKIKIIFPMHPRTRKSFKNINKKLSDKILIIDPLPYIEFLGLMSNAKLVVTDSGGIQEETTYLGVPCLTIRENTERPITIEIGTNYLVGTKNNSILKIFNQIMKGDIKSGNIPTKWDGKSAERVVKIIKEFLSNY